MFSLATIVVPVLPGQESNLEPTLRHLQKLGVSTWARTVVISTLADSQTDLETGCEWIQSEKQTTWGDLLMKGLLDARKNRSAELIWLALGVLPREGTLPRLHQITRGRKAITAPGKVIYPCRSQRSGGFLKSFFGLAPALVEKGKMATCDTISELCACIPMTSIHLPKSSANSEGANFWNAQDLGLILTSNGVPCLIDGESEVDVLPNHTEETESWLLSDRPVLEIWKGLKNPACPTNPKRRLQYFTRHWGVFGCVTAMIPVMKLAAISLIRALIPLRALRQIYGRHSSAWQLQKLHDHEPMTESGS